MAHFHGSISGKHVHGDGSWSTGAYSVIAESGSYSLAGQDVDLRTTASSAFTLAAEFGTYLWEGRDALVDSAMNGELGTFTLTGFNVSFTLVQPGVYVLAADGGSYALTGIDANFIYTQPSQYAMFAEHGIYTLTGRRAQLLGPGDVPSLGEGDRQVKLALLGYTGALSDMLLRYYQDNGATSNNLTEAEMQFLALQGASAFPLNNRRRQFYSSLGYEGSLNDMEYQYWWNL